MTTQTRINGVRVEQLAGTIDAIKENPDLARFNFRAHTQWIDGAHARTRIQSFYGAGRKDVSRSQPFVLDGDEPPVLLGENRGPNAVEAVLHALASCLAVGLVYNAAAFDVEGEVDLHGFLGLSDQARPGYKNIRVNYRVQCDAPRDKVEELCEYVRKTSPGLDIIQQSVPVTVALEADA